MLLDKYKTKFGQKFFASPEICTPIHLCLIFQFFKIYEHDNGVEVSAWSGSFRHEVVSDSAT